jgi:hypothetical protein
MTKTLHGIMLLMLPMILALSALSTFVFASQDVSVTIIGCNIKDYRVINGTMAVTFLLRSDVDIQRVIFRYKNEEGLLTNVTMSLIEGDRSYGWWEANPIRPRILERVNSEIKYHIDASTMLLYVFISDTVYEVSIPQNILPQSGLSTERIRVSPEFHQEALLASSVTLLIALGVVVKRVRRSRS